MKVEKILKIWPFYLFGTAHAPWGGNIYLFTGYENDRKFIVALDRGRRGGQ